MPSHAQLVKDHFELDYQGYDEIIPKLVPGYHDLKNSVLQAIPFQYNDRFSFLDLGCGTGILAEFILNNFPNSKFIGVDVSEHMIQEAQKRLEWFGERVKLVQKDFFQLTQDEIGTIDFAVSMLAIHHFEDKEKVYRLAHSFLKSGQQFILADLVVDAKKNLPMREFRKTHMRKQGLSEKEIERWFQVFDDEDRPSPVEKNILLLEGVKFSKASCFWKNENYATIVAIK